MRMVERSLRTLSRVMSPAPPSWARVWASRSWSAAETGFLPTSDMSLADMSLKGKTIVTTRAAAQSSDLRDRLVSLGARVIECPTIEIASPESWDKVDEAISRLNSYDWLL